MKKELYIGVMSGTSMDGIDVALCAVDKTGCQLLVSYEHPFCNILKEDLLLAFKSSSISLEMLGEFDSRLGTLFAEAVNAFVRNKQIDTQSITAIGSHGQTLWHQPEGTHPFTMQWGDPNIVAAQTGMRVIADFRRKDMAFGGSGAPLAPAFHQFLFGKRDGAVAVVNIGGIANISVLGEPIVGYDTGPGNMLMDAWILKHLGKPYDKDGKWARSGKVDYALLDAMMDDDYFKRDYPKSTGRERFNPQWVERVQGSGFRVQKEEIAPADMQRTLLELTALSISNEVLKFNPDMLLLCGGGAKNGFLVERIAALMPNIQVAIMEQGDWIEAMMMAWLAYKRIHEEPVVLKEVTGASRDTVLGAVYL